MKIQIKTQARSLTLRLPTGLICSRGTAWLVSHVNSKHPTDALAAVPPQALPALFAELRRVKKKYGHWDLVEVESADGESIHIWL